MNDKKDKSNTSALDKLEKILESYRGTLSSKNDLDLRLSIAEIIGKLKKPKINVEDVYKSLAKLDRFAKVTQTDVQDVKDATYECLRGVDI